MIEIGGELRASMKKNKDSFWKVAIESPDGKQNEQLVLNLVDHAMATSGTYRNFYYENDKKYTHIINPETGNPISHNLLSVTVIAKDCLFADAWATALMVLGEKKGLDIAQKNNLKAYFIMADTHDGSYKTLSTTAFSSYYEKKGL